MWRASTGPGLVGLENDEAGIILHMRGLGSAEVTALCMTFGTGNLESVLQQGWLAGYG